MFSASRLFVKGDSRRKMDQSLTVNPIKQSGPINYVGINLFTAPRDCNSTGWI